MRARLGWVFVFASSAFGCSSTDGGAASAPDAALDGAALDDAAPDAAPADAGPAPSCTDETPALTADGKGSRATTTHYELYSELSTEKTTMLARLLEASSAAFARWFERPVPTADGGRLKVKVFADRAGFLAALAADALPTPDASTSGFFAPSTKTAYLYEQGNPYYTQVLTVHEAAHQFHRLSRLEVPSPPYWYVEGLAEYLSRHDWDGRCVRLGVTPLVSWEDIAARASDALPIDVAGLVEGRVAATRPMSWALFRYLDTGPLAGKFRAFRDAFDANAAPSFADVVADPASLSPALAAWLPKAQEPMKPIFTEWVHLGPDAVLASTPKYFSLAMVKAEATHLEAKAEVPAGAWTVGVVAAYTDPKHYVGVVRGSDGRVRAFTMNETALWSDLGTAPPPTGKLAGVAVDVAGGKATVRFDGASFTLAASSPSRLGLAANDTTAKFVGVSFR